MTLETEERDRCRRGLVSCLSGWEQTVVAAEEPRALSVRKVPVRTSWECVPGCFRGFHRGQNLR